MQFQENDPVMIIDKYGNGKAKGVIISVSEKFCEVQTPNGKKHKVKIKNLEREDVFYSPLYQALI